MSKTHEKLFAEQENVLRLSKSGCSLKVGWSEKRIVASLPGNDIKNCNQQWIDDAERLCDGWNKLPKANEEIATLRQELEQAQSYNEKLIFALRESSIQLDPFDCKVRLALNEALIKEIEGVE